MPVTDIIVVCAIISAFAIFALVLAWGDYQTRKIARTSPERAASSVNVVSLRQNAAPENRTHCPGKGKRVGSLSAFASVGHEEASLG